MIDVTTMLINLANNMAPVEKLVTGACYVAGVALIFRAFYDMKVYGNLRAMTPTQTKISQHLTVLFVGVMFLYFPSGLGVFMQTTFGYSSPLAFSQWSGTGGYNIGPGGMAILRITQAFGLIIFVRGFLLLIKSQQPGSQTGFRKAITHIIGGLLCINIVGFWQIAALTLS